ncbi:hypothetical protein TNCV_2396831 [Trichonephila clavipes]|uniref:Uncharacterized protein n=1 Tax=Trichonephila clavipes TaxID=2585209 RepID=A0A8X6VRS0_TRICX|nr:hypothetical protein TNCV_2396831 [Trichonephila clavipes]
MSGRRMFWQTVYSRRSETGLYTRPSVRCVPLTASIRTGYGGVENISHRHHKVGGVLFSTIQNVPEKK